MLAQQELIEELRSDVNRLTVENEALKKKIEEVIQSPIEYFLLARLYNIGLEKNNVIKSSTLIQASISIRNGDYYITNEKLEALALKEENACFVMKDDYSYVLITPIRDKLYRIIVARAGSQDLISYRIDTNVDEQDKENREIKLFVKKDLVEHLYQIHK